MINSIWMSHMVNQHFLDATGANWDSTTTKTVVVPSGKRWFLLGGVINRSDSAAATVTILNAADKVIRLLCVHTAATGKCEFPSTNESVSSAHGPQFFILDAGMKLDFLLGAAQGAAAYIAYQYLEVTT